MNKVTIISRDRCLTVHMHGGLFWDALSSMVCFLGLLLHQKLAINTLYVKFATEIIKYLQ